MLYMCVYGCMCYTCVCMGVGLCVIHVCVWVYVLYMCVYGCMCYIVSYPDPTDVSIIA